jgi:WD40-like Beta Propeller Repeat
MPYFLLRGLSACTVIVALLFLSGCSDNETSAISDDREPEISPDYAGVTIPPNIAPLNFSVLEKADAYVAKIHGLRGKAVSVSSRNGVTRIPLGKWKTLLSENSGADLSVDILTKHKGRWGRYRSITVHIAAETIDPYLVYRLIEPGFVRWNTMGIYQRNLETFEEVPVALNELSGKNCMNCHSFCHNDPSTMLFHVRGAFSGTVMYRNGKLTKVSIAGALGPVVYPAWHPSGKYVAFSVNKIVQRFHSVPDKTIEVQDTLSEVVLFNVETNKVSSCSALSSGDRLQTLPCWAPDGRRLYYCSARVVPPDEYDKIRYDLLSIAFDPDKQEFGAVDTVVSSEKIGMSVSFPRISPDGRFALVSMSQYGNFTIWHRESDLYLVNIATRQLLKPGINSPHSESFHSWSSNGRWIVFSSRRTDGRFTRPYIAYFDEQGTAHKPFVLPQKDPGFYLTFMKSYNLPELVTSRIRLTPRELSAVMRSKAEN